MDILEIPFKAEYIPEIAQILTDSYIVIYSLRTNFLGEQSLYNSIKNNKRVNVKRLLKRIRN